MRLLAKVPASKGPCPLCGREMKLDTRGKPWAHKCPHGSRCLSLNKLGMPGIPTCPECCKREKRNGEGF